MNKVLLVAGLENDSTPNNYLEDLESFLIKGVVDFDEIVLVRRLSCVCYDKNYETFTREIGRVTLPDGIAKKLTGVMYLDTKMIEKYDFAFPLIEMGGGSLPDNIYVVGDDYHSDILHLMRGLIGFGSNPLVLSKYYLSDDRSFEDKRLESLLGREYIFSKELETLNDLPVVRGKSDKGVSRYFFVDLENQPNIIKDHPRICGLNWNSELFVFYSPIVRNSLDYIRENFSNVECIEVGNGFKNELDFNLVLHLGYLMGKYTGSDLELVILTKDKGFMSILDYINLREFGFNLSVKFPLVDSLELDCKDVNLKTISLIRKFDDSLSVLDAMCNPSFMPYRRELASLVFEPKVCKELDRVLCGMGRSCDKLTLHNKMVALLGSNTASTIYSKMKDTLCVHVIPS